VRQRKIRDRLGRTRLSMTEDYYIRRGLADRETADALENLFGDPDSPNRTQEGPGDDQE